MLKRRTLALLLPPSSPPDCRWHRPGAVEEEQHRAGDDVELPGLDPTAGAASAIAEIVLYNVFETLTKINGDGKVTPLLAESWEVSPDLKTVTFKLRKDAKFQNGEPFNSQTVKCSFTRAAGEKSTNKDKRLFQSMEFIGTPDRTPWSSA